jgi:hypothetical protein
MERKRPALALYATPVPRLPLADMLLPNRWYC